MNAIIFSGLNWLLTIIGVLGMIGIVFLLPGVIVGAVLISREQDEEKKKAKIKKGIIFSVIPFGLVLASLIGIVVLKAVQALLAS